MPTPEERDANKAERDAARETRKAERDKRKAERKAAGLPPDPADEVDDEDDAPHPDQTLPGDLPKA